MSAPRLLAGLDGGERLGLRAHLAAHGPLPRAAADGLAEAVEAAGLRGRGGAGFPTAAKLRAVAGTRRAVVLVNLGESEPLSAKDRVLAQVAPHLVLDGAEVAARAVGARRVVVAVRADAAASLASLRAAIAERGGPEVELARVPAAHLAGEESALVRYVGGGPLRPTLTPPRPAQRGVDGRPTLVQNAETLAHVALIARHGPAWFRAAGAAGDPGTALVTVCGDVARPGVDEIALGARLADVLGRAGGVRGRARAVLIGGFHGTWLPGDAVPAVTLDRGGLRGYGASLAAGVLFVLGERTCPVREVGAALAWLAGQSAAQCGPCRHGLPALADELARVADGHGRLDLLHRWSGQLAGRGACRLPDGVVRFLAGALEVFAAELADHVRFGPCDRCHRPPGILPRASAGWAAA